MAIVAHFFTPKHKKSITPAHNPANVMLLMEWSWRDSNPRPHSKTICFLHAYSGLRFSCIGKTRTTNQCLIL